MADETSKQRLGRGLAALIGEMDQPVAPQGAASDEGTAGPIANDRVVPIESIAPNPNNPKKNEFDAL